MFETLRSTGTPHESNLLGDAAGGGGKGEDEWLTTALSVGGGFGGVRRGF